MIKYFSNYFIQKSNNFQLSIETPVLVWVQNVLSDLAGRKSRFSLKWFFHALIHKQYYVQISEFITYLIRFRYESQRDFKQCALRRVESFRKWIASSKHAWKKYVFHDS